MENELKHLTHWLNHLLGPLALQLLHALHIQPADYDQPIPEYVVMSLVVVLIGTLLALVLRSRLSVERPGGFQQAAELLLTNSMGFGIKDLLEENIPHGASKFIPFLGSISIFILLANLLSIFPEFSSPTVNAVVPLACASLVFIYFNWQGIRHHGTVRYLLTFAGSPKTLGDSALAVLLFPVEIISTLARLLSLTVRLWANIFASDLIYVIFLGLLLGPFEWAWTKNPVLGIIVAIFPAFIPLVFIGLHIFVSVIQAYIFTVLPAIYVGLAVADDH
ncbi:MAG TPA: FoF1 ATP synthase subunit a [Candidatus Acidoferrales bacterium]|jgi:F-type H+-transporting ATPase subunit a|nr:FoF1 ATP synthase subunit a [Candidatus Acidoferrales bacterium]